MSEAVLWQIRVSHYSEKIRWALDHKQVEYERRSPMPSVHMLVALRLTRGRHKTLPVVRFPDGEIVGDSTAIIGALEQRYPAPPLYPEDPVLRRRALDLEEFFDEELAPHLRQLAFYEVSRDPKRFLAVAGDDVPPVLRRLPGSDRVFTAYAKAFTAARYRAGSADVAERSRVKVLEALDRLERELDGGQYLAGESFSVADLTAAALFYPLVLPPEGPQVMTDPPPAFQAFRDSVRERPGYRWVAETFSRHRRP